MGNQSQIKSFRKQIRKVMTPDMIGASLGTEAYLNTAKDLAVINHKRMDEIGKQVDKRVDQIDNQTQTFRNYVMRETDMRLGDELANISLTVAAWQDVLTKRLGITDMAGFEQEVSDKKHELTLKYKAAAQEAADAEALAQMEANAKAAAEAPATSEALGATIVSEDAAVAPAAAPSDTI